MRPPSTARTAAFLLLASLIVAPILPACATVGYAEARNEDVPLKRGREEVPQDQGALARVFQDGTTLTVTAARACDIRETATVRRTARRDRINASPTLDWVLGGLGVGAVGAGAIVYADASKVHPRDDTSREYNPVGPDNARLAGGALVVAGAALASVALVDAVRTSGEEQETSVVELPGETVSRSVRCKRHPLVGAPVALALPGAKAPIPSGQTDAAGKLTVRLEQVLQDDSAAGATGEASVLVAGAKAGTISLAPLQFAVEEAAWKGLYKEGCSNPQSVDACKPVEDFLRRHPDGKHAQEARLLLGEAAPAIQGRRDEEAWRGVDPDACSEPKELSSVELACSLVRRYLADFPQGAHAAAARAALKKGEPLAAKQRRKAEQEAEKELAEEERRRKEEERKEKAEERKAKAEEQRRARKLRECVRSKCNALCKMKCPYSQSCREGCVELCVSSDQVSHLCEDPE